MTMAITGMWTKDELLAELARLQAELAAERRKADRYWAALQVIGDVVEPLDKGADVPDAKE